MKAALAVGLFVLCVALTAGAWEADFAENPSAEEDINRDGQPDGWVASAYKSPAATAWDKTVAHSGKASLRISDSLNPAGKAWDESTGRWVARQRRPVTPGAKYTLGAWIKTQGVTGKATACIAWWSDKKWLAESYTKPVTGTTEWQWMTVTAEAPANATAAQIYLNLGASKGTAWFDDISMVKGDRLPGNYRTVDIAAACNTGFTDETPGDGKGGWTDQGKNDMRNLPTGDLSLRGVPFHIISEKDSGGRSCVVLKWKGRESMPESATIPVGQRCDTICFLHACAWGKKGTTVGRYDLVYEDGTKIEAPVRCDHEIADWWRCRDTQESAVGWEGSNAESDSIGLSLFPLSNPQPQKTIKEIRFSSAGAATLMLVAITLGDGPAALVDAPLRMDFTDTSKWYPFNFPLDDTNLDTINLTSLLDPPAGKHGFLTVREDGHFYFEDGTRARFFGTNICGRRAFCEKPEAEMLAARLAKYGVNLLRIHSVDSGWGLGLIDYSKGDSRHMNEEAFDRLDYFIAELKKRGIYVYLDGLDYRRFQDADGVKDASKFEHGWRNSIKGATCYDDRLIELQKEFDEKFFTHYNPYTKLRYADDPVVAVVEITNENSVFYFSNEALTLPYYVEELRQRWNKWLIEKYGDRAGLAKAWTNDKGECALLADEDPARGNVVLPMKHLYQKPEEAPFVGERSPARVSAMVRFFFDLEQRYYGEMRACLKKIGIKAPITGTNQTFCPASVRADAGNDFMSRNNYWCHPNFDAKPFFTFKDNAVVNSDIPRTSNPVTEVASSTVAGKPMIVPEFNFPWPNEFRAECLPLMAAYGCLQDWDGMLFFAYDTDGKALTSFGNQSDPVRWGEVAAAALLFLRRDVAAARKTVHMAYSEADIFTARPSHSRAESSPFRYWTYLSKVRNSYFREKYEGNADIVVRPGDLPNDYAEKQRYVSDTGELILDRGAGLFTIVTPMSKAVVGFLGQAGRVDLNGATVECKTPFAAVMVTSLDGKPVETSKRILITAVARAENTGQAFYRKRSSVPEQGRPPALAEPVECELALKVGGPVVVYALDETGKRRNKLDAQTQDGLLRMNLSGARSPWCEVVLE